MPEFPELPLDAEWVEQTLKNLTLDQKIGQLLHPCIQPAASETEREQALGGIEPGGMFIFSGTRDAFQETTSWFQQNAATPLIISSDLEHGAGRMILDATTS